MTRLPVADAGSTIKPFGNPWKIVPSHQLQRGVVLLIALIILMAMSLATIALVRSVDTGTLVAGNLGFKQSALQSADTGSETAINWLVANKGAAALNTDNPANGYYATKQDNLDLTGNRTTSLTDNVDWDGTHPELAVKARVGATDAAGNQVSYIIHRLCTGQLPSEDPDNLCAVSIVKNPTSSLATPSYGSYGLPDDTTVYYRITTRITGPKNTITHIQTFITM